MINRKQFLALFFSLIITIFLRPTLFASTTSENSFIPPPVFSSENHPCSDCHEDMEPNTQRRQLEENHSDIVIQGHGEPERWCLDCHDATDRNKLILLNGEKVEFLASYKLCQQCHGAIFKAWEPGIHGKRVGRWDGPKKIYLCVS